MRKGAEALGVNVVDPPEFRGLVAAAERADKEATLAAEREERRQRKAVWIKAILGAALAFMANVIWEFRAPVVRVITAYGILALVAIAGAGLYALRGRYRLVYGVAETAVGYLTAVRLVFPTTNIHSIGLVQGIGLLGGLYIIVRGLDNVAKGLENTAYKGLWRRYSGEVGR
jgi:hypothetical protein